MKTKIYAKQVPPEYQESPLYAFDEWPENVYVFGNRHLRQHAGRVEDIRGALEDIASEYEYLQNGEYSNSNYSLAEIASAAGVDPDDVILQKFTGWHRTPVYAEV